MKNQDKNLTNKSSTKKTKKSVLEYEHDDEKLSEDLEYVRSHSWQFSDLSNQKTFYYD